MVNSKKEEDPVQLETIRGVLIKKINSIKKKFDDSTMDEFSLAFRVFILRYLKLDYEFTDKELLIELEKKHISAKLKDKIIPIFNTIDKIKYEGTQISQDEFKTLLKEAIEVIDMATQSKIKYEEKNLEGVEKKPSSIQLLIQKIFKRKKELNQKNLKGKGEEKEQVGGEGKKEEKKKERKKYKKKPRIRSIKNRLIKNKSIKHYKRIKKKLKKKLKKM